MPSVKDLLALAQRPAECQTLPLRASERSITFLSDLEARQKVLDTIAAGVPVRTALGTLGFSKNILDGWRQKAYDQIEPYASFVAQATQAEQRGVELLLANIRDAATGRKDRHGVWQPGDVKANIWLIERLDRSYRAEAQQVEHTHLVAHAIDPTKLSDAQLAALEAMYDANAPAARPQLTAGEVVDAEVVP